MNLTFFVIFDVRCTQARNQFFFAPLEKCVGHSVKLLDII